MNPFRKFQRRSLSLPSTDFSSFVISDGKILPNKLIDAKNALKNSDVYSAVNLLASDIAGATVEAPDPIKNILAQPNNLISGFNFWQTVVTQMLLAGNAYVVFDKNSRNIPTRMELAPASQVEVTLADKNADITYQVNWMDERGPQNYKSSNMLHFRLLAAGSDYTNTYIGMSPLESLQTEVNMQDYSNKLTLSSLKHALNPSTVLTVPEGVLDPDEKDAIRKGWETANEGENQGRAIVLDQAVQMSTVSINADVAKFLANLDFGKTQIAKAFGIPDSYLNGAGDQQSSLDMTKSLYANTLRRYVKPIESELALKLNAQVNIDERSAVDADGTALSTLLQGLVTTKVISPETAAQKLQERGVI